MIHSRLCAKCSQSEPFLPSNSANGSPATSILSVPPTSFYFPDSARDRKNSRYRPSPPTTLTESANSHCGGANPLLRSLFTQRQWRKRWVSDTAGCPRVSPSALSHSSLPPSAFLSRGLCYLMASVMSIDGPHRPPFVAQMSVYPKF